jgi:hypothetical protein
VDKGKRWDKEDEVAEKVGAPKPNGRPSKYSEKVANKICAGIANGKPLRKLAKENGINISTIFHWLERPGFYDKYAKARELQAEFFADQLQQIADEKPRIETVTVTEHGETKRTQLDSAGIQRNRLRVDTRKWLASKFLPKKYGEHVKVEASGPNGQPLPGVNVNLSVLTDEQLEQLAQITTQLVGNPGGAAQTS